MWRQVQQKTLTEEEDIEFQRETSDMKMNKILKRMMKRLRFVFNFEV